MSNLFNRRLDGVRYAVARLRKRFRQACFGASRDSACGWGILGCGGIAHAFARGLAELPSARLRAVASRRPGAAAAFARQHDGEIAFENYENVLADQHVDIVYIATPHAFHHELARACLEAGKNVLCEKPMTVNARQAEELMCLAKARGRFLMEALWTRFLPAIVQTRRWMAEDRIGPPHLLSASFGFYADVGPSHRLLNPALAGGALLDIGIYPLSLAGLLWGYEPTEIKTLAVLGPTGVDVQNSTTLKYSSGAMAHLWSSFQAPCANDATISGQKGYIRIPDFWKADSAWLSSGGGSPTLHRFRYPSSGLQFETEEAMRCIRAGHLESSIMPWNDTLGSLRLMDRLRAAWGLVYPGESKDPSTVT